MSDIFNIIPPTLESVGKDKRGQWYGWLVGFSSTEFYVYDVPFHGSNNDRTYSFTELSSDWCLAC